MSALSLVAVTADHGARAGLARPGARRTPTSARRRSAPPAAPGPCTRPEPRLVKRSGSSHQCESASTISVSLFNMEVEVRVGPWHPQRSTDLSISYEVIGEGRPWAITPGGRFSKDYPGVRELAETLAREGNQVLIYDRPNCGASDVCFTGASESAMQADTLAALLTELDMAPAVIIGGSGGARVSMLTAARHREVASGLAFWWISGGAFGLMSLGMHYCGQSLVKAWHGSMEDVVALPEWEEVLAAESVEPSADPRPGPPGVHRHDGAVDAGLLPVRRRTGSRASERRRPEPRPPHVGVPQRRERRPPHPRDVGAGRRRATERAARRASLG